MKIEKVSIYDLSQDPANVRKHGERNLDSIMASLRAFGQQKPIVIDSRGIILAGNGTFEAAKRLGWLEIDAVKSELEGTNATAYAIADNRTAELAEWDETALAEQLRALQSEEFDLSAVGFDDAEVDQLLDKLAGEMAEDGSNQDTRDNQYTAKVEAPIYTPKGEKPSIESLIDRSKTDELCNEINSIDMPKDVRDFLTIASQRHTVFNFRNIAEFYCHATANVQHLMERSGLIIIDFDKAIQNGFVHMTDRLGQIADIMENKANENA